MTFSLSLPQEAAVLKEKFVNEDRLLTPPSNEQIKEELALSREFIKEVKNTLNPERIDPPNTSKEGSNPDIEELLALLETAVNQQQSKADNPGRSEPEEIISFSDTDARFGCKSEKKSLGIILW